MKRTLAGLLAAAAAAVVTSTPWAAQPLVPNADASTRAPVAVKLWDLTPEQAADPTIAAAREAVQKSVAKTLAPTNPPRYLFLPVTPCTVFDTRYATNPDSAGFVSDGMTKRFTVSQGAGTSGYDYTAQGGSECGAAFAGPINGTGELPEAVLMTSYVSDMSANGWITFYAADQPDPSMGTISVYYSPGPTRTQTVATQLARVYLGTPYEVAVTARYGGANVSASVVGFFIRQNARTMACGSGSTNSTPLSTAGDSTFTVTAPACPTNYLPMSLSCTSSGDTAHVSFSNINVQSGECGGAHTGTGAATVSATPYCCRIPADYYPY